MKIEFNVKGTEKQVAWCKDILKDFNELWQNVTVENIFNDEDNYKSGEEIINLINSETADFIINNKCYIQSEAMNKYFDYEQIIIIEAEKHNIESSKYRKIIKFLKGKSLKRF